MSEYSRGANMDLHYKNDLPNGSASTGSIADRADGLVAAEVYGATPEACDALGRKMAAAEDLVAVVRYVLRRGHYDTCSMALVDSASCDCPHCEALAALKKAGAGP